jgi:hypothetical protein
VQNCSEFIKLLGKLVSLDRLKAVKWPELVADLSHAFNVKNRTALPATHSTVQYSMWLNRKGSKTSVKVNIKISNMEKHKNRSDSKATDNWLLAAGCRNM